MSNTKQSLHVLHDSAVRGGPIAAGYYERTVLPREVAAHMVATGRARWEQVPLNKKLLTERQAPKAAREQLTSKPVEPTPAPPED